MSFIVPGQGQKKEEAVGTRTGAKPLNPESAEPAPLEELPQVEFGGWPEELQQVVVDEFRRTGALATYRWKTADDALVAVVRGLDDLLDLAADRIEDTEPDRSLRKVTAAEVDFGEVADLLGIPADELGEALVDGRPVRKSRADRKTAQRAIKQLRVQLEQVETTMDHSRLNRLVSTIVRLVLVLGTAVGPQSAAELVSADESQDAAIRMAVGALAAFALERTMGTLPDAWHNRKPAAAAAEAHEDLLESLADADAFTVSADDRTVSAFRVLVRSTRAWIACFQLEWSATSKIDYWQALDEIPDALQANSAEEIQSLHDGLEGLTPPTK